MKKKHKKIEKNINKNGQAIYNNNWIKIIFFV